MKCQNFFLNENPYALLTHAQIRWSLYVWGGIIGNKVIRLYFFGTTVNSKVYWDLYTSDWTANVILKWRSISFLQVFGMKLLNLVLLKNNTNYVF